MAVLASIPVVWPDRDLVWYGKRRDYSMTEPLVKNAGDPEQVKKAGKTIAAKRQRELSDLNFLMQSPAGRRFVKRIIDMSKLFIPRFGTEDGLQFAAGLSYIGIKVIDDLEKLEPKFFVEMLTEGRREK